MSKKSNDKKKAKKAKNNTSKEEIKNNKKALENAKNEKKTKESKAVKEEIKEEIEEIVEEDIEEEFDEEDEDIEDEIDDDDENIEDVEIEEDEIVEDDADDDEDDDDDDDEDDDDDDEDDDEDDDDEDEDDDDEDEDDDDEDEDDDEEVKIEFVENKPKKEVKENKKKEFNFIKKEKEDKKKVEKIKVETKNSKIAKIEKKVKENKKKKKNFDFNKVVDFFEDNHLVIYGFIGGALLTTLIAFIIWPDRIAALKNGEEPIVKVDKKNYTADYLYEVMKDKYSVNLLLDEIDADILEKIYPENDEMNDEVNSNANYYFDTYEQYGYTQEKFLEQNGFANLEEFLDYLRLDYRRNKYLDDYITKNLTDDEINDYYEENVFGDINTQHILVEVSKSEDDGKLSDEDAKTKAEEIINKLNDGTSWDDIKKEYKDDITFEDLGYQSWDANLEQSFMDALIGMDDNSYSEDPVKTSYGYHVIYRLDQKKTPKLKKVKDIIIDNLITEKKSKDTNLASKALISLREEKNIKFSDTVMKDRYDDYCAKYE